MAVAYVSASTTSQTTTGATWAADTTFTWSGVAVTAGQLHVLKVGTGDYRVSVTGVTDSGGNSWTSRVASDPTGNYPGAFIFTTTPAVTTTVTITVALHNASGTETGTTASVNYPQGYCLERWSGAAVGATNADYWSSTTTSTITTTTASSYVTWVESDWNGVSGTATFASSATATGTAYRASGAINVFYEQQSAATVGAQTYGATAPTGMRVALGAVELIPFVAPVGKRPVVIGQAVGRAALW